MAIATRILCEPYAGLRSQGLGLAEAAELPAEACVLAPKLPWRLAPARIWLRPLAAVGLRPPWPDLAIGVGGVAAAVGAALRSRGVRAVQVQHPRMRLDRFDLVVAARHDGISGPNVLVTRTALHRVTPQRLAAAAAEWRDRLAYLPRPLVAVLVGGTNGRFRLDVPAASVFAAELAHMARRDRVGLAVTPSRRTGQAAMAALATALAPEGAYVWDGQGENPYFGLLGLADAIVVTIDSVSMISEAVATPAPVMLAPLPGRSRRSRLLVDVLARCGRVRPFVGRFQHWRVAPLNDTAEAASQMRRRLGLD
ncbi:MAG: mitochondrial fission ELM1 family protein [Acetobacteraceae bacterium]